MLLYSSNSKHNGAAPARGFIALFAMLAMGLALSAFPAEAAPFAYVVNELSASVSVIETGMSFPSVVATIPVGGLPEAVAVTPDGKHAYVAHSFGGAVSVIDTATNTVGATVLVGGSPRGVAVTPDGKHAYITGNDGFLNGTVVVIATASNAVVATVPAGGGRGIAITPDGKFSYVTNIGRIVDPGTISVIDTASNKVVAIVPVGSIPTGVAVTPDGKHAYVTNESSNNVSVIDTATNTVGATVPVGSNPLGVAVTPDGKHAYVKTRGFPGVSVIETASNTVVATLGPGGLPGVAITPDGKHAYITGLSAFFEGIVLAIDTATNTVGPKVDVGPLPAVAVAIVPPPPGVPFLTFNAKLAIHFGGAPNQDAFIRQSQFTLSSTASNGINPVTEPVTLQIGTFSITIPPRSFSKRLDGSFRFLGVINGVILRAAIWPTGTLRYAINAKAQGANLTGTKNTVYVTLSIGDDSGATSVNASISP